MMAVFYIDENEVAQYTKLEDNDIAGLLKTMAELRARGLRWVTSCGEDSGADIVRDGKLPNGQPYTWTKRR